MIHNGDTVIRNGDTVTVDAPAAATATTTPPTRTHHDRPDFRPDIQGLRAVAVIVVVLYHAGVPILHGGYIGVDVFFVISGFVITTQLLREMTHTGRLSVRRFYARRIMRLLPAAVTVMTATLITSYLWLPRLRWHSIATDALTASGYFLNIRLAAQGTDYMSANQPPSPLQHFWSLAVEEQFYLIWPILLGLSALWLRRHHPHRAAAAAIITTLAATSLGYGIWETNHSAPWSYFGSPTRAWELATGALIALAAHRLTHLPPPLTSTLNWLGLAAITTAITLYNQNTPFPGYAALLPVLGAAAIITAGCATTAPTTTTHRLLSTAPMQGIGQLSYSWYLWHWPLLMIAPTALGLDLNTGRGLVLAVMSLILAGITYVSIEDPLRRSLRNRPWRAIITGTALSGTLALATTAGLIMLPNQIGSGQAQDTQSALAHASVASTQLRTLLNQGTQLEQVPANLTPPLAQAANDQPRLYHDGCDKGFTGATITNVCAYGDPTAKTSIVLFGDSHAGHWFPALDTIAHQRGWKLYVMTKSACSAATSLIYLDALKRPYTECVNWRAAAIAWIRTNHPTMVIMSSNNGGPTPLDATGDPDLAWTNAWLTTTHALHQPGTRLTFISDTPWPGTDIPDCLSAHFTDIRRCARPLARALSAPARRTMVANALGQAGVHVIDPVSWFCTDRICPAVVGNIMVYKDDSHISTAYSTALAPVLGEQLTA